MAQAIEKLFLGVNNFTSTKPHNCGNATRLAKILAAQFIDGQSIYLTNFFSLGVDEYGAAGNLLLHALGDAASPIALCVNCITDAAGLHGDIAILSCSRIRFTHEVTHRFQIGRQALPVFGKTC